MKEKRFQILYTVNETLSADDLWPDGDMPENPTADDVRKLVRKAGGIVRVIDSWGLGGHDFDVHEDSHNDPDSDPEFGDEPMKNDDWRDEIVRLRHKRDDLQRALYGVLRWAGIQPANAAEMRALLDARDDAREVLSDYSPPRDKGSKS